MEVLNMAEGNSVDNVDQTESPPVEGTDTKDENPPESKPETIQAPGSHKKKTILESVSDKLEDMTELAKSAMKETVSIGTAVKTRTMQRRKNLLGACIWRKTKQIIAGNKEWTDKPPILNIGEIGMSIDGGVGKVTYVEYHRDPKSGGNMRDPNGGGLVKCAYVEEVISPMSPIEKTRTEVRGCPTIKEVQEGWETTYAEEKRRTGRTK